MVNQELVAEVRKAFAAAVRSHGVKGGKAGLARAHTEAECKRREQRRPWFPGRSAELNHLRCVLDRLEDLEAFEPITVATQIEDHAAKLQELMNQVRAATKPADITARAA
jgi:hypothetical protein